MRKSVTGESSHRFLCWLVDAFFICKRIMFLIRTTKRKILTVHTHMYKECQLEHTHRKQTASETSDLLRVSCARNSWVSIWFISQSRSVSFIGMPNARAVVFNDSWQHAVFVKMTSLSLHSRAATWHYFYSFLSLFISNTRSLFNPLDCVVQCWCLWSESV